MQIHKERYVSFEKVVQRDIFVGQEEREKKGVV